jgi:hypothetical protein
MSRAHRSQVVPHWHAPVMRRREVLQAGFSAALGSTMAGAFARPAGAARAPRAKGVLVVWMPGGPPQMQFWDPKPDSPVECRGTARPIPTSAPGVQIGARLPLIAQQAHRFAVVRSVTLDAEDENHIPGGQELLGAINQRPANFKFFANRGEYPSMGSVVSYFKPNTNGLPTAVHVPYKVRFQNQGVPGETAGWLGGRYDPWLTDGDPNKPDYRVPDLLPLPGFGVERLDNRRRLLEQIDGHRRDLEADLGARQLGDSQARAFRVATSTETRRAFDLAQESDALRDRYGRHTWGQSLLLGRRLLQAGVKFVQVNLGDHVNYWDYHDAEDKMMDAHCPPFDKALSAFFEDMGQQGMLDDHLVLVLTEMGRNPILGRTVTGAAANAATPNGRNHWQWCWSALMAGAGVRGGTVYGESDEWSGYVKEHPVFPADIGATVFHTLGIPQHCEVRDLEDRPLFINTGEVLEKLF